MSDKPILPDPPAIEPVNLRTALEERYLAYALSTIMHRALPDVRDGLKPVHRRLLYAMRQLKLDPDAGFKKCAKIVGEVMGNYHPHGDQAIYDALVRLAQDFAVRYRLVDGQGNFGNIDGDNAAAMRYTEARLTDLATALLEGIDEDAVDFRATYDGTGEEPVVLPGSVPHLLANGASGIAVGMATSIPPHNIDELCQAALHLIKHPNATVEKLVEMVPAPDFPTGGLIVEPKESMLEAYRTGRGAFRVRAKWHKEETGRGTYQIVVTEIPYQVQKSRLVEKIAELLQAKKLPFLDDVRDESAEDIRLVLDPKSRTIDPVLLMESLFRVTELEVRVSLNMNVLSKGQVPKVLGLREVLREWLDHRQQVLIRRSNFRLAEIARRLEVLAGYLIAYLNLDEVIRIIRFEDEPKARLMGRFKLTEVQTDAILNMRLRALNKLQEIEIRREHDTLSKEQGQLKALSEIRGDAVERISEEVKSVRTRFRQVHARRQAPLGADRCPRDRGRSRCGADREGADHRHPVGEGLDPCAERPPAGPRQARLQAGRYVEAGDPGTDDRQARAVCHQRPVLHARLLEPSRRTRPWRAGAAPGRSRGQPRHRGSLRARSGAEAPRRLDGRQRLRRSGIQGRCHDTQGQAGAQSFRARGGVGLRAGRRRCRRRRWRKSQARGHSRSPRSTR